MSDQNVKAEVVNGNQAQEQKSSDKDVNVARLRQARDEAVAAYQQMQKELEQLKSEVSQAKFSNQESVSDDESIEDIYAEVKKLKRELRETKRSASLEAQKLIAEERKTLSKYKLKTDYPDFEKVVTPEIADKLVEKNPRLAEMLSRIPEDERLPLLYETIQLAGIHKKADPEPSIQEQINKNQRNPYYMAPAVGHGQATIGDFSESGRKNAYDQMRQLMKRALPAR